MQFVIAPARNVRPASFPGVEPECPLFSEEAASIIGALRRFSPPELESLLDARPEQALELYHRYQLFGDVSAATPALASYHGAAYRNLNIPDFDAEDFAFAQDRLRMLSTLYGLLRPADGILPHRLGFGCGLRVGGKDLYAFWGDRVYRALFPREEPLINLASQEYAKLFLPFLQPWDRVITCRFLIQRPDGARGTVSTVRAARGQMARYLVKQRIGDPEGIKAFDWDGYRFIPGRSDAQTYVFIQQRHPLVGALR